MKSHDNNLITLKEIKIITHKIHNHRFMIHNLLWTNK